MVGCLTFLSVTSISVCVRIYLIEHSKASFFFLFFSFNRFRVEASLYFTRGLFKCHSNSVGISDFKSHEKIFIQRNLTR